MRHRSVACCISLALELLCPVGGSVARRDGLVGRPSVFGLQLVSELGEPPERPAEGARDAVSDVPCGVRLPAFDAADGGLVEPGGVGERLLGQPGLTSAQADRATERDLWCWARAHAGTLGHHAPSV